MLKFFFGPYRNAQKYHMHVTDTHAEAINGDCYEGK